MIQFEVLQLGSHRRICERAHCNNQKSRSFSVALFSPLISYLILGFFFIRCFRYVFLLLLLFSFHTV